MRERVSAVERDAVFAPEGGRVMTKQSDALASDINSIVARHVAHRIPLPVSGNARYGDFSDGRSYHEMASRLREVEGSFSRLPADIRKHCGNDPGNFLDMVYNPERVGELEKLGLKEAQKPVAVVVPVPEEPGIVAEPE